MLLKLHTLVIHTRKVMCVCRRLERDSISSIVSSPVPSLKLSSKSSTRTGNKFKAVDTFSPSFELVENQSKRFFWHEALLSVWREIVDRIVRFVRCSNKVGWGRRSIRRTKKHILGNQIGTRKSHIFKWRTRTLYGWQLLGNHFLAIFQITMHRCTLKWIEINRCEILLMLFRHLFEFKFFN